MRCDQAATIEGSISVRCVRRRYDWRFYCGALWPTPLRLKVLVSVLNTHARPCVATDAATIEGSISVRCVRRRYDWRFYFGALWLTPLRLKVLFWSHASMGVHGGVCLVLNMHDNHASWPTPLRLKVLFRCVATAPRRLKVLFRCHTTNGPLGGMGRWVRWHSLHTAGKTIHDKRARALIKI